MKLTLTKDGKDKVYDIEFIGNVIHPIPTIIFKPRGSKVVNVDSKNWDKIVIEKE
jgi:hypothetical protein